MKLQKIHTYDYGNKPQFKHIVTIQEDLINQLGWESGSELEATIRDNGIQIRFVSKPIKNEKPKTLESKMTYPEFRDKIKDALEHKDNGMTWTELKELLELEQVVPNNRWVRQLEKDIGLKRIRDTKGIVWRGSHV